MEESLVFAVSNQETCRLCLQGKGAMTNVFKEEILKEQITHIVGIQCDQNDDLPVIICHRCRYIVEVAYELRLLAAESHKTLMMTNYKTCTLDPLNIDDITRVAAINCDDIKTEIGDNDGDALEETETSFTVDICETGNTGDVDEKTCIEIEHPYTSKRSRSEFNEVNIPEPDREKKRYEKYDPDVLNKAVLEYLNTKNLREVVAKYDISPSVLIRHSDETMKTQALTPDVEDILIENINTSAEWGYPLDKTGLRYLVKMFLDKLNICHKRFKNNMPGPDWAENFFDRHKGTISQRMLENIKSVKATVSPETITKYFNELRATLTDVPPCNIINYDESHLTDDPARRKVVVKRGCNFTERIRNRTSTSISIMMTGTADGHMLTPYVVYNSVQLYDTWLQGAPEGTLFNRSNSGWFEGAIFEDWVNKIVIPYFHDKIGSKYLIGDYLSSHLSIDLIKLCKELDINFIFVPPNSTHLTQPLEEAFFRPMTIAWRNILLEWKKTDGRFYKAVPKSGFPKLLKQLLEELKKNSTENILVGFRRTGISPLNLQEILNRFFGHDEKSREDLVNDKAEQVVSESVLGLLKETRYDSMNIIENKRKRKLILKAGCSVNAEDIENYIDVVNIQTEQKKVDNSKPKISKKEKGIGKKTKTLMA